MAKGDPLTSPYVYEAGDYQGKVIRITVTFDNATRAITGCTVHRDAGCVYNNIYVGLGGDGTPNSTTKSFKNIPTGDTVIPVSQLVNQGLTVIEDILALQITAGP